MRERILLHAVERFEGGEKNQEIAAAKREQGPVAQSGPQPTVGGLDGPDLWGPRAHSSARVWPRHMVYGSAGPVPRRVSHAPW
ncbi:hypothetical protein ABT033_04895 [Streptomyces pharetrae]|uniref:hypothetical protein n=1 Tax=Streptomyces pharetrae TaxID=291370 RepID=UPI00334707B8